MHGCVFALLLIDLRCIHTIHSVHYKIPEEQSEGTVIGILITKLPSTLRESLPNLRFRSLHDEEIIFFFLNATTSELSIRQRIDRETVCPNLLTVDNVVSSNTLRRVEDNDRCELSFRVNILRLNNISVDIVNMIRVYVEVEDIDDNKCTFLPKERQDIYIKENVNFTKVTLNKPVDLDTNRSNNLIRTKFRLVPMETTTDAPLPTMPVRKKYLETWNNTFQLNITETPSQVAPFNLELWINRPLDYEIRQEYAMRLFAGGRKPNRTCALFIMVHVEDENDHKPMFEKKSVHLKLMENASTLHPIYVPKAHDGDAGPVHKTMLFELSSLSANSIRATFYVVSTNGSIYLRHPLRHSQQSQYKLTLVVRNPEPLITSKSTNLYFDGGTRLTEAADLFDTMDVLIDVIDVNDNSPIIEIYSINGSTLLTLTEHLDVSVTDFAVVSVTDDDSQNNGQVTCMLDDKSMQSFRLTRIGPKRADENGNDQTGLNGALYKLSAVHAFDRESTTTVDFAIICHDHGQPSRRTNSTATVVILDVNDHAPQFSSNRLHVQVIEDSDPSRKVNDYFVLQVNATDLDSGNNSRIRYLLKPDNISKDLFLIESYTGILRSKGNLDREQNSTLHIEVMAVDNGQPEQSNSVLIDVQILDYNDEAPEFLQAIYEFQVQENVVQGYHVGTVVACDRDSGENAVLNFHLKDATSDISESAEYRFENHLLPFRIMSHYVPESQCYAVRLFTSGPIDRESLLPNNYMKSDNPNWILQTHFPQISSTIATPKYELELMAEDKGLPRQTNVVKIVTYVTDVNDEKPKFLLPRVEHRSTVLSRYEPRRFEILKVFAVDEDEGQNGTVQYYLESLDAYDLTTNADELRRCKTEGLRQRPVTKQLRINLREYFELNSTTGLLSLSTELPDRLVGLTLQLNVLAKDIGMVVSLESVMHVCITITDSPPQHANGTMVGRLRYASQQRTMFYVYIFTAILVFGLLIAAVFVLFGYFCWHHPKSRKNRQVIKIIRYNEAEGNLITSEADRMHTTHKTNVDNMAAIPLAYSWPMEETAGTQTANFHSTFRYNSTNPQDSHPADGSRLPVGHGHTDIQSLLPTADRVGYLCSPFEHMPNQSMYYTLANAHAVNYSSETPYVGYCEAT
ncbi:Protocadherin-11 Y-linked [Paragonimus heterotremus]|uniref:Protocadherin-11 Y-linked n=1 Tax=Paragonimus heterotremus TaxID=100268 RepID=A0A8J4WTR2_9TREM|nr:Protocadherin-11 Y-linked [Paragonimus heterotremus]